MSHSLVRLCACIFLSICALSDAVANDELKTFSVSGFGTFGIVHSDSDKADIVRDLLQKDGVGYSHGFDTGLDSLLGLQLNVNLTPTLDGAVQVVARRTSSDFRPDLTWAFARYSVNDHAQVRVGRLGFDAYLLADSRNVGYSYQWVRPPIDYFGSLIISYFDGADSILSLPVGEGAIRAKIFTGRAREKTSTGNPFNPSEVISLEGSSITGGHIEYQNQEWVARIGYSRIRLQNEFPSLIPVIAALKSPLITAINPQTAVLADDIAVQDKHISYLSGGVAYDSGPIQAQFMLSKIQSESLSFPGDIAGYATVGYRINKWTPYVTFSAVTDDDKRRPIGLPSGVSPSIDALIAAVQFATTHQLNKQHTLSFGARYDLSEKVDIKAQFDHIENSQRLLIRNEQAGWDGKANLISIAVNFIF